MARSSSGGFGHGFSATHGTVTPMPARGEVIVGRDHAGRVLRMSSHPEIDRVVLSIWQDERCLSTFRLTAGDVPDLVRALIATALPDPLPDDGASTSTSTGTSTGTYGPWGPPR